KALLEEVISWGDYFQQSVPFGYCFEYIDASRIDGRKAEGSVSFGLKDIYSIKEPFTLKLTCVERDGGLSVDLYYDHHKFDAAGVDIMCAQLRTRIVNSTDPVSNQSLLSALEEQVILTA